MVYGDIKYRRHTEMGYMSGLRLAFRLRPRVCNRDPNPGPNITVTVTFGLAPTLTLAPLRNTLMT